MTASTSDRERAWSSLFAEVKRRFLDVRLDGPWELGHRNAIEEADNPVDLVVELTGYSAGLAVHGRDNKFVQQKIDDALALFVKYG
ncbi:hypothetical protein FHT40_005636 [Mycolicibacterium sp. BK556]|uniref:hypothetical protein n=1 Tax=Mycobacteriaceae TaxID=1762 RepID=UPI001060E877|nr:MULTISPECIES: hypothetical protein [Mycobacteriaceae]MBB3605947.1 hypothetical protein [Mycolicibacterium sp. BK556]MBB3632524.1 hypothetical protein [Mycolicibacterium sp. BK607]MBB3753920.1 hypothetical protein [Mycolicibacterium sp. BK634]TDO18103.1 hypothetical protein EV580_1284 [Mycobacterium sp. BK086]